MRITACAMTCLVVLTGCANPFADFYRGVVDARANPDYDATETNLWVFRTSDLPKDSHALLRKGYLPIGHASFTADSDEGKVSQARAQAEKIGAQVVLLTSRFSHTESRVIPLLLPNTTRSFTTGSATAYGAGGSVTAFGSAQTTTYGNQTTLLPMSVSKSQFVASFFAKVRHRVGVVVADLDDEQRRRLQSNAGVVVIQVVEETDAFLNDVLPGDVITEVGTAKVYSFDSFQSAAARYEGRKVAFTIIRDGREIEKRLRVSKLKPTLAPPSQARADPVEAPQKAEDEGRVAMEQEPPESEPQVEQ